MAAMVVVPGCMPGWGGLVTGGGPGLQGGGARALAGGVLVPALGGRERF